MKRKPPAPYLCGSCKLGFVTYSAIREHAAQAHPKTEVDVYAPVPGLSGRNALNAHRKDPEK